MKNLINDGFNSLVKAKYGYVLFNKNDQFVGKSIELYGEFSNGEMDFFKQIVKPDHTVVEVGANIGSLTLPIAQLVGNKGKVIAFEPQRIVFQTLCANIALNSIENTECYNLAVGYQERYIDVPVFDPKQNTNFGGVSLLTNQNNTESVPIVKLDSFLQNQQNIHFIKIDVEGMEIHVLEGARNLIKQHKPILYVENDRVESSKNLIELLWNLEYKLFWHISPLFNPNNYFKNNDNVFGDICSFNMIALPSDKWMYDMSSFEQINNSNLHPFIES